MRAHTRRAHVQTRKQAFDMALADWALDTGSRGSGLRNPAPAPGISVRSRPVTPGRSRVASGPTALSAVAMDYTIAGAEQLTGRAMFTSGSGALLGPDVPIMDVNIGLNDQQGQSTGPGSAARLLCVL